jgi:hypothetical protein
MPRALLVLLVLVVATLLAFGAVADRALEGQAQRVKESAAARGPETARLTAASVRAALARLEQEVVAGRAPAEVDAERLAIPPDASVPGLPAEPYARLSRDRLAQLLHSTNATSSGLPVAVVARIALGEAAFSLPGGKAPPDVPERLLSGSLPVRPEDLPTLARARGVGGDPRVGQLQKRLRRAPAASGLPFVPTFRRTRVGEGVEAWARERGERVHYAVPLERLLALAGVADRAAPARVDAPPANGSHRVAVP